MSLGIHTKETTKLQLKIFIPYLYLIEIKGMSKKKIVHWGILGCGKIANKFAADLMHSNSGKLMACASRDMAKAQAFAEQHNVPQYYGDYASMLEDGDVDIIYIATPHNLHFEITLLCARYKKHILCEKPLAVNKRQVLEMTQTAKEHRIFLMEALWTAFLPAIIQVKEEVEQGTLGEIRHIQADFGFKSPFNKDSRLFNPALAGGSLLDIGIYPIFIAMWLLGKPLDIQASIHKTLTGVDDECAMMLTFANGQTASLYSTVSCDTETSCIITGTEGSILIPSRFHEQETFIIQKKGYTDEVRHAGIVGKGYYHEIEHVHECLSLGLTESPIMTHDFSMALIDVMDTVREKAGIVYPFE